MRLYGCLTCKDVLRQDELPLAILRCRNHQGCATKKLFDMGEDFNCTKLFESDDARIEACAKMLAFDEMQYKTHPVPIKENE